MVKQLTSKQLNAHHKKLRDKKTRNNASKGERFVHKKAVANAKRRDKKEDKYGVKRKKPE